MQKQIGLGRNGRLTPPEDFSRKATHCVYAYVNYLSQPELLTRVYPGKLFVNPVSY
jgi:hypothetical protein